MEVSSIIIGAVGIVLMVYIPGYCLTLALFAKKEMDFVERSGISFILGLIPQFLLYALDKNLTVFKITPLTTYIILILVCLVGLGIWYKRKEGETESETAA